MAGKYIQSVECELRQRLAAANAEIERLLELAQGSLDCLSHCPNMITAGGVDVVELRCKLRAALKEAEENDGNQ